MFVAVAIVLILGLLYLYGTRRFDYWEKRGVLYEKPYPFVGNSIRQLLFKVSFTDFFSEFYKKYPNERFIGLFSADRPILIITEPRDIQRVLVTDFNVFYPRGLKVDKYDPDPFLQHLFAAEGDIWKLLRQRMTPAFTTGKLKAMFPLIVERAEKLQILAEKRAKNSEEVDIKDLMARYTTDFIGACGFGVNMDALEDENSAFRKLGNRIFNLTKMDILRNLVKLLMPRLTRSIRTVSSDISGMTTSLVNSIMEDRNYQPSLRHDFIDLLLEVKQKGKMVGESIEKVNADGTPVTVEQELSDELIAAQAFIFFAAGFETSSSTSSYTMHLLAFHQEEQRKCQEEIDKVLQKYDNKLCYDAIKEMKYLKMCFYESMRLFPSVGVLFRQNATKYTFPDSDLTIDEETAVVVCNHAMQLDEKYFDEPTKFIPDRFSPENEHNIPNHVFLPFGEGPRACIGERLGLMQSLAGLAAILSKFTVVPSKNTKRNPPVEPLSGLVQTLKGGVPVLLKMRKKDP